MAKNDRQPVTDVTLEIF